LVLLLLEFLLEVLRNEITFKLGLILLTRGGDNLRSLLFGFLHRGALAVARGSLSHVLFLVGSRIVTQVLIDHVAVDVGVGLETATIGRVAQRVCLLLNVLTLLCALLTNLLHLLDLIFTLEVLFLNLFNSVFILLFKALKFIHAHVHNVFFRTWIGDHHAQIGWKLIQVQISVLTAECA
jgi:hypothetical protein